MHVQYVHMIFKHNDMITLFSAQDVRPNNYDAGCIAIRADNNDWLQR